MRKNEKLCEIPKSWGVGVTTRGDDKLKHYNTGNKPHGGNYIREGDNRAFDIACPDQASAKMINFA